MILKYNINNFYNIFWSGLTCISHHNTTFGYKFLAFKMNYLSCKYNFLVLTLFCVEVWTFLCVSKIIFSRSCYEDGWSVIFNEYAKIVSDMVIDLEKLDIWTWSSHSRC